MHRPSRPLFTPSKSAHVICPHSVYPLSSDLVWGPVWERKPASDDSSIILKLQLKFLLQLQHLWRITVTMISNESQDMMPTCPSLFEALKIPMQNLLIIKKITSGQIRFQTIHQNTGVTLTTIVRTSSGINYEIYRFYHRFLVF